MIRKSFDLPTRAGVACWLSGGAYFGAVLALAGDQRVLATALVAASIPLGMLAYIDLRWRYLPDPLVALVCAGGLTLAVAGVLPVSWPDSVIGMVAGYGVLGVADWGVRRVLGRPAFGQGDWKLFGAIGAWVGIYGLAPVAALAGVGTLLVSQAFPQFRHRKAEVPLGPGLIAGWVALTLWQVSQ